MAVSEIKSAFVAQVYQSSGGVTYEGSGEMLYEIRQDDHAEARMGPGSR